MHLTLSEGRIILFSKALKATSVLIVDPGKAGKSFKTTLDSEVQKYTTEILADKAASVCVMDIYNGDIVSLVSSPSYDPNAFVHGVDRAYWNSLINNDRKPLTNKAVSGLYPPGSTLICLILFPKAFTSYL